MIWVGQQYALCLQGGLPAWLLKNNGSVVLRTMDPGMSVPSFHPVLFFLTARIYTRVDGGCRLGD